MKGNYLCSIKSLKTKDLKNTSFVFVNRRVLMVSKLGMTLQM